MHKNFYYRFAVIIVGLKVNLRVFSLWFIYSRLCRYVERGRIVICLYKDLNSGSPSPYTIPHLMMAVQPEVPA